MTTESRQTSARAFLAKLKRAKPPSYPLNRHGHDRLQSLVQPLLSLLPDALRQMLAEGRCAIGEVGEFSPDVRTFGSPPLDAGQFVIVMNSGCMDFHYAAARAMNLRMIVNGSPSPHQISQDEVTEQIARVFQGWRDHCQPKLLDSFIDLFSPNERIGQLRLPITEKVRRITEGQANETERFILAHELGHVAIDSGLFDAEFTDDESKADAFGADIMLNLKSGDRTLRDALQCLGLAIRITDSLQRVGVEFSKRYPLPEERLWQQLQRIRVRQSSGQYFDEACTLLVSSLDQMDEIDRRIDDNAPKRPSKYADWQATVRMIAVLEAATTAAIPPAEFYRMCTELMHFEPLERVKHVGQTLLDYYIDAESPIQDSRSSLRKAMGDWLRELVRVGPEELRGVFPIQ